MSLFLGLKPKTSVWSVGVLLLCVSLCTYGGIFRAAVLPSPLAGPSEGGIQGGTSPVSWLLLDKRRVLEEKRCDSELDLRGPGPWCAPCREELRIAPIYLYLNLKD